VKLPIGIPSRALGGEDLHVHGSQTPFPSLWTEKAWFLDLDLQMLFIVLRMRARHTTPKNQKKRSSVSLNSMVMIKE
jgi:hypothetical protein